MSAVGLVATFLLTALSLIAMALATKEWFLIGPLLALLAAASRVRIEGNIPFRTYILLGIPFAALARFHPVEGSSEQGLNIPFYVALYLNVVGIRKLASPAPAIAHVVFCATSGIAAVGADTEPRIYKWVTLAVLVPLLLSVRGGAGVRLPAKRGLRGLGVALGGLAVLGVAEGSARFIESIYEDVSQAFIRRVARVPLPSAGGFSGGARLGNVTGLQAGDEASTIAVRAFARFQPGYLRGKSFQDYEKGEWTPEPDGPGVRPMQLGPGSKLGRLVIEGRKPPASGEIPAMRIVTASDYGRYFFLPLQATALDTTSELVKVAPGRALESPFDSTAAGYAVFTSQEPVRGTGWTKLPSDPALLAALDRILEKIGPQESPLSLAQAIRTYFARRYTYKFGIEFEPGSDPLVQFLTKKDHGHCELFASAGTLLFRRRGVPARYTTGYLCMEKNTSSDDLWVARNRHAHAWVEFENGAQGWQLTELTPDAGMPSFHPATGLESWLDALSGSWQKLKAAVAEEGVGGLLQRALRAVGSWLAESWPGRLLLAVGLLYVLRRGSKRLPRRAPRRPDRKLPPELEAERQRYLALERTLRRRGLRRGEGETLEEFARRLEPGDAAAVKAYAARRYARFS